ncbi:acyltransferase family protein [Dysgonomonas macrotermitis]|nr:acyltransferase family protein [Dysgonomonas macrotermitis]
MNKQKIINKILNQRYFYMGIAMLLVVLYHCYCAIPTLPIFPIFSKGYIGVDLFLFFSGLGLSYSYNNKTLKMFLQNRFTRILPLYWIWAIVHLCVVCVQTHTFPTIIDVFGLFTTLSYYGIGAIRSNWYLSALLFFYLFFPLLFKIINKWKWYALFVIAFISAAFLYYFHFSWYHDAFIGRFYIFCLGIYVYSIKDKIRIIDCVFTLLLVIVGIISLSSSKFQFWGISCICPAVIILLSLLPDSITKWRPIILCGQYSLEIFIANCWTMLLMGIVRIDPLSSCIIYFLSNVVFALVLIAINKNIQKRNMI